nr:antiterminator Q family protein [Escherichia coli]
MTDRGLSHQLNETTGVLHAQLWRDRATGKGLLPQTSKSRLSCTDDDGLIIEGCLARLQKRRPNEHSLLVAHYLYGISKRKIAKARKKDEKLVRIEMQMAEGFIDGCLSMLDIKLDMD